MIESLAEVVEINPKADRSKLTDSTLVSFVPMAAVGAGSGGIALDNVRPYAEVKKGYTHFRDGDILFAKITPCMENGKMAVAHGLQGGVGLGSTEFHVLRPRGVVDPHYVYYFVSSASYRKEAAHHMTGAVGQKRVPVAFLEQTKIPVPPVERQREIVAEIEKQFSRLDEAVANLQRVKANVRRYRAAVLRAAVDGRLVPHEAEIARRDGGRYETGEELLERVVNARRTKWSARGKFAEASSADTSGLATLPEGWVWASAEQLSDFITKGTTPSASRLLDGAGDVQFLKVYN